MKKIDNIIESLSQLEEIVNASGEQRIDLFMNSFNFDKAKEKFGDNGDNSIMNLLFGGKDIVIHKIMPNQLVVKDNEYAIITVLDENGKVYHTSHISGFDYVKMCKDSFNAKVEKNGLGTFNATTKQVN